MELMLMEQQLLRSPLRLYSGGAGPGSAAEEEEKRAAWARTPPALQLLALGGRAWPAWPQPLALPPDLWIQKPPAPLRYCPYPPPAHPRPDHSPSPRHPLWAPKRHYPRLELIGRRNKSFYLNELSKCCDWTDCEPIFNWHLCKWT